MQNFSTLLKHEIRMLLISPPTYIAAVLFLTLMAILYSSVIGVMVNESQDDLPMVQFLSYFWIPVFFVVPLLTMRSIAEERRAGTLETLMTTPTSRVAIILSKFFGAYSLYMFLWLSTLSFPMIVTQFFPSASIGTLQMQLTSIIGGYTFLALSGILFISIGIFASSITRSQLVAGMFSFTTLFVAIAGVVILENRIQDGLDLSPWMNDLVTYLQIFDQLHDFSSGVIDTRPFFYYTSMGAFFLSLSVVMTEIKK